MPANAVVRARIDQRVKDEATAVLSELGLTVSDLVRITLTRVARDKALPFDLKTPNAETRAVMQESRAMMAAGQARFPTGQDLIDALDKTAR